MKVISIMNAKGGTGKTITAVNLAGLIATAHNKKVLLIDCDGQADASDMLVENFTDELSGLCSVMEYGGFYGDYVVPTKYRNLFLMPGGTDLWEVSKDCSQLMTQCLMDLCKNAAEDGYDFIIIDCPPAFAAPSVAALCCSDHVIVPVTMDAFSIRACNLVLSQISFIVEHNPDVVPHVLITKYSRNSQVQIQAAKKLRLMLDEGMLLQHRIGNSADKVSESTFYGELLDNYSKYSSAGKDYRALARTVLSWEEGNENV